MARRGFAATFLALAATAWPCAAGELTPDDPYFPVSWHHGAIDSPAAWGYSTGSGSVRVAVLDSGLRTDHPDLAGRVLPGWNVVVNSSDVSASSEHGTAVTGIVAAGVNNGVGVSGMGNFQIVPVKVTQGTLAATWDMVSGINWVADNATALGIRVLVMCYYADPAAPGYAAALANVRAQGVLPVISMPNNGAVINTDTPNALLVGGTDKDNVIRTDSARGAALDLVAPSVDIWTTYYDPKGVNAWEYAKGLSGNSWATPQVAGAAGLIWSINPSLTVDQVEQILLKTARDLGAPGRDDLYGHGLLDVGAAAAMAYASVPEPAGLVFLAAGWGICLIRRGRRGRA